MENVSFFNGFRDCTPYEKSLNSIVQLILSDEALRNLTETHRYYLSQNLTRKADHLKSSVGCFAVAVRFEGGKSQTHISDWTGLGIVDVDDLPPERMQELFRKVCDDPHTLLAYVTLSGHGLRIVFRYDIRSQRRLNDRQRASFYSKVVFEHGNRHFGELLGFPTDTKCRNCTRLSGLAYDPHACYRPAAEPFVFDDDSLNAFFRPARRGKVSLKTAVLAAEQQLEQEEIRFEAGMHNRYVMRMGYLLNAYGVDLDTALDWAIGRFSDEYEGDIAAIFRSCYQHTEEHGTQRIPRRKAEHQNETWASVEEVESFLEAQMHLRFNVVKHQCEYCWKREEGHTPRHEDFVPLTDRDENTVWCRMNKNGQKARLQDIRNVLHSEFVPLFNPFTEYFRSLPAWDGVTDYIGQLARTVHVKGDQERFVEYFRKWFVGILPALFEEQVVNHEIMVFIGRQGNYKSTFFSLLLPPPLQPYFHVKMNNNHLTKDDFAHLVGICFGLSGRNRRTEAVGTQPAEGDGNRQEYQRTGGLCTQQGASSAHRFVLWYGKQPAFPLRSYRQPALAGGGSGGHRQSLRPSVQLHRHLQSGVGLVEGWFPVLVRPAGNPRTEPTEPGVRGA